MALPAIEISSSTYVMHSGDILYRHVYDRFDDFDGGGVSVTDFLILLANWGPCP